MRLTDLRSKAHRGRRKTKVLGESSATLNSTEPNANLVQVEWIYAKKLTRTQVPLQEWNKDWHDHKIEIAGGRVQVLDLPPDKAKEVADLVATTDGMIYHFYFGSTLPTGKMSIAQAVGHKPMTSAEYKNYESK